VEKIKMTLTLEIKNWKLKVTNFIRKNKKEVIILGLILLVGAFFRLYKINEYMTFLGDEGRDVIIVRNLLVHGDPILIGPGTSVGGMYLGPLYYYFMAPFLLLANFSPVGPAIGVALLGVATIWLVWYVFKSWFPTFNRPALHGEYDINYGALAAATLYALSPTVIIYSRSSWNPNIMPFFALLSVFSSWKAYSQKKYNWSIATAVSFAFVLQSHYLGLIILPLLLLYPVLVFIDNKKEKNKLLQTKFIKTALLSFGVFVLLMSPLALFDLRHDFLNSRALYKFLTVRQETVSIRPWTAIPKSYPIFEQINTSLLAANNLYIGKYISLLIVAAVIWFIVKKYLNLKPSNNLTFLVFWYGLSIIGFGIYKQHIYDHYYGFLFAVPFLLLGVIYNKFFETKLKFVTITIFLALIINFILRSPLKNEPNNQMLRAQKVAEKIKLEAGGNKFNLGVIAERNYEDGYKYFLIRNNQPVVNIDSQIKESITDQLFVICEMTKEKCDPTHNASAAVANFGWSKVDNSWEVDGVTVYKLIHSQMQ
jgi:4-amino-4-deoxy-L-arabinose transferase-like glycosyltransferase